MCRVCACVCVECVCVCVECVCLHSAHMCACVFNLIFSLIFQIDKEKCLLLAYDHHYRSMTGNGIFSQFDCSIDNINDLPVDQLISSHSSVLLYSSLLQEVYSDLCELNLLQQSDCQTKSVYRPSSYEVCVCARACVHVLYVHACMCSYLHYYCHFHSVF